MRSILNNKLSINGSIRSLDIWKKRVRRWRRALRRTTKRWRDRMKAKGKGRSTTMVRNSFYQRRMPMTILA